MGYKNFESQIDHYNQASIESRKKMGFSLTLRSSLRYGLTWYNATKPIDPTIATKTLDEAVPETVTIRARETKTQLPEQHIEIDR